MSTTPTVLIIGAGPTGLGAAWRLQEIGYEAWQLIEGSPSPGGLAGSVIDDAGFTWDFGGHVLFSHYEYFDRLMDAILGNAWVEHTREAWVLMRDRFIPYPLQNNIWCLPSDEVISCLEGLLTVHARSQLGETPETFRDWILQNFGPGLADVFLFPYNWKVWAYEPAALGTHWMSERVAKVDLRRVLRNLVLQHYDVGWGPNALFRFPLKGGTGAIWSALCAHLPANRLHFGQPVTSICTAARCVRLADGTEVRYDALISSIPLDLLLRCLLDRPDIAVKANDLMHSSSHIIGVGIDGPVPDSLATKCWMYLPEQTVPFYRVTVFSNYSPYNVPEPGHQWSLLAEVSESAVKPVNGNQVLDDVVLGLRGVGLLSDDARIVSRWHKRFEHGYPTPFLGRDLLLQEIDCELRRLGIWSRGRFGAWKYEVSNMDHSLMQGVEAVDHILFGTEETTYSHPAVVNESKGLGRGPILHRGSTGEALHGEITGTDRS